MIRTVARRVLLPVAACLMVVAAVSTTGLTASNTVPVTGANDQRVAVDFGPTIPLECAGMSFDSIIIDNSAVVFGTNQPDLIIGGPNPQIIFGGNGTDCIAGGGGNDVLYGDNGRDVLIGGPGDDILWGGNSPDVCYGGPGDDTFWDCETIIDP